VINHAQLVEYSITTMCRLQRNALCGCIYEYDTTRG
jgi:hypothetical protein